MEFLRDPGLQISHTNGWSPQSKLGEKRGRLTRYVYPHVFPIRCRRFNDNLQIYALQVVALTKLATERFGCSVGQLALAWCLKNENVSTVLLGLYSSRMMFTESSLYM